MYRFFSIVLLLLVSAVPSQAQRIIEDSLKVDGQVRRMKVILPDGIREGAPLVFVAHGYGNEGKAQTWMDGAAAKHGFAICVPQGLIDPAGRYSWNVGYTFQQGWRVDDVKALERMAAYVQKKYRLSKDNTFLTGMSNGGEMCYLMGYSQQHTFKAVAPVSGLTMRWTYETMSAPRPIPVMEIHGTRDHTSEWTGDLEGKSKWGAYLGVPTAIGYWVARNRCTREVTDTRPSLDTASGHYVIRHKYTDSPYSCDVWLYEVVGGKHSWHTKDLDTGEEIWHFFSRYIK